MKIVLKIAWRNIWRNKLRSLVVATSIFLGIWSGIFVGAFGFGLNEQRKESMIRNHISHLQIHNQAWLDQKEVAYTFPATSVDAFLENDSRLSAYTTRSKATGMVSSAHYSGAAQIIGINPSAEAQLSHLDQKLIEGEYFPEKGRNPVIIGMALAEKLEVKIGSRIILNFSDGDGNIVSSAFKVKGFYEDVSSKMEELNLFVRQADLQALLGLEPEQIHEIACLLKEDIDIAILQKELRAKFPTLAVQSWKELSPELAYADEIMTQMLYIIIGIIMMALSFGIINTMLMAVLERRRELGMLMCVGMSKTKIFSMIMVETFFLALLGGPLGILFAYYSVWQGSETGLNLAPFSDGLASYGVDSVIYPVLPTSFYWGTAALVFSMTLIAAIYPARRALKLNPVETLRTI
jgi:ABC-type lipoprotein release transport system permease subunit